MFAFESFPFRLPADFASPAVGVGQVLESVTRDLPPFVCFLDPLASHPVGVAHVFDAACRSPPPLAVRPSSCFLSEDSAPPVIALGVGHIALAC
jgi:hypothetical protein